jgi:hypothetical protein
MPFSPNDLYRNRYSLGALTAKNFGLPAHIEEKRG